MKFFTLHNDGMLVWDIGAEGKVSAAANVGILYACVCVCVCVSVCVFVCVCVLVTYGCEKRCVLRFNLNVGRVGV